MKSKRTQRIQARRCRELTRCFSGEKVKNALLAAAIFIGLLVLNLHIGVW
jgi:hypothetical protein